MELTLENFYHSFLNKVNEKKDDKGFITKYKYNSTAFTELIIELLEKVLTEYGYNCKKELKDSNESNTSKKYYRIDLIGWTTKYNENIEDLDNILKKLELNKHIWNLDIAIEHENDYQDWLDEVIKLAYINCPIRIVIGYVDRTKKSDEEYLDAVIKILDELENQYKRELIKKNDSFGIILESGNIKDKRHFSFGDINYQLYKIHRNTNDKESYYPYPEN